ncbi:MAG: hypothetical protein EON52_00645, partial [Actinomycetales bacterium]
MTSVADEEPLAGAVLTVSVEAPTSRRRRVLRVATLPLRVYAAGLGVLDEPSFGDVVVRRRDDASEVLRVAVHGSEETAIQVAHVRAQLDDLTEDEFLER